MTKKNKQINTTTAKADHSIHNYGKFSNSLQMCLSLESNKGKRDQKGIINIGSENGEILQTKIIIIKIKDNKA